MKAAICTSDGSKVDLHFGKTSTFYIFSFEKGSKILIEKRNIEAYSPSVKYLSDEESHSFDPLKFEQVYRSISDCKRLYTVSIGDIPKQKLQEKGIDVQICKCSVALIPDCNGKCK